MTLPQRIQEEPVDDTFVLELRFWLDFFDPPAGLPESGEKIP